MKKVLILGGSSYVGRHLVERLNKSQVIPTYNKSKIPNGIKFDSRAMNIEDVVDLDEINCAIILLGDTDPESCTDDIKRSEELNVESIKRIIDILSIKNIKVIFSSSEFVYAGDSSNYNELNYSQPILLYGKQKLEIEHYIEKKIKDYAILRFAKIYGTDSDDNTLFTSWLNKIIKGDDIVCADDQYFSPVHISNVVDSIVFSINNKIHGIYNLAGPDRKSRIEFLDTLMKEVKSKTECDINIIPCSIDDFPLNEKRPKDVSMNPSKLVNTTGIKLITVEESCEKIVKRAYGK